MSGEPPKTERRTFLALGASAVLAGCTQTSSGGNSGTSTTMESEAPTSSSSVSTTRPDLTPTRSSQPTPTSNVTTPEATTTWGTERSGTNDEFDEIHSNETFPQTTTRITASDPSTDGSAKIFVWNDAEIARQIRVAITDRNAETSVLQRTYRIEADAYVEVEVTKPGAYTLDVGLDGDESATIDFPIDTCNSLRINVAIRQDGTVNSSWLSTAVGCATVVTTDTTHLNRSG